MTMPKEMLKKRQWITYGKRTIQYQEIVNDKGKADKALYSPITGYKASSIKPDTWGTYEQALLAYDDGRNYNGIGYVFTREDNIVAIDLDNCFDPTTGIFTEEADDIINKFKGKTFIQYSQSGKGAHILTQGLVPHSGKGKVNKWVEIYGTDYENKFSARYFCMTGNSFSLDQILPCPEEINWLFETYKNEDKELQSDLIDDGKKQDQSQITQNHAKTEQKKTKSKAISNDAIGRTKETWKKDKKKIKPPKHLVARDKKDYLAHMETIYFSQVGERHDILIQTSLKLATFSSRTKMKSASEKIISDIKTISTSPQDEIDQVVMDAFTYTEKLIKKQEAAKPQQTENQEAARPNSRMIRVGKNGNPYLVQQSIARDLLCKKLRGYMYDMETMNWFKYGNGFWEKTYKEAVSIEVDNLVTKELEDTGVGYTSVWMRGVSDLIKSRLSNVEFRKKTSRNAVSMMNGTLDLTTRELMPHSSKNFFKNQLPYSYNPKAQCPTFLKYITEATNGSQDVINIIRAFMNATVVGRSYLQKYLEVIGYGGTGKGTLVRVMENLVGLDNVHTTSFNRLEGARSNFETALFANKKMAVINEADTFLKEPEVFKKITGGDAIPYEEKNKQTTGSYHPEAMFIVTANKDIKSSDTSSGLMRRKITIYFKKLPAAVSYNLDQRLTDEIDGILNWVLEMDSEEVENLLKNHKNESAEMAENAYEAQINTNTIAAWVDQNVVYTNDGNVKTRIGSKKMVRVTETVSGEGMGTVQTVSKNVYQNSNEFLYPNYLQYCEENNAKPAASPTFVSSFMDLMIAQLHLGDVTKHRTSKGYVVDNVRLRTEDDIAVSPLRLSII